MLKKALSEAAVSVAALVLALLLGAIVILFAGKNPQYAYHWLFYGAFGTPNAIAETLNRTAPLILTGLAVAFAFRGGLFNIGGEGQYLVGGFAAVWVGFALPGLAMPLHLPLCMLAGMLAAGAYGILPAYMKARFGVHEVISTIMLNWIARFMLAFLVTRPMFLDPQTRNGTHQVPPTAIPPNLFGTEVHVGILIAIAMAVLVWFLLERTTLGYDVKAVGFSPLAAEYGGIPIARAMMFSMFVSGALAGLAGAIDYPTINGRFPVNVDFLGKGFDGIAVALIGRNQPIGVVLAALVFGALSAGQGKMQMMAEIPKDLTSIVQAFIILFMVAPGIITGATSWMKRRPVQEAK